MNETRVWKYVLRFLAEETISMPTGAELLCFENQCGEPCLWVRVNPNASMEERRFFLHGTGHSNARGRYVGSALFENGTLVFHLFEREEEVKS